jgi:PUA domain protein
VDLEITSRHFVNKKRKKALQSSLIETYGENASLYFKKGKDVEEGKLSNDGIVILCDRKPSFFKEKEDDKLWIPFVDIARDLQLKNIIIDQPAVPYISNGADVMRPGIVYIDDSIEKGDIVAIMDERNKITIAIGEAKFDHDQMEEKEKGKVIRTLHYPGDDYWDLKSEI